MQKNKSTKKLKFDKTSLISQSSGNIRQTREKVVEDFKTKHTQSQYL